MLGLQSWEGGVLVGEEAGGCERCSTTSLRLKTQWPGLGRTHSLGAGQVASKLRFKTGRARWEGGPSTSLDSCPLVL